MKALKLMAFVATVGLLITSTAAVADEVIIIHRSGKIQTLQIDGAADPVEQVSFRRKAPETAAAPQAPAVPSAAVAATPPVVTTAPAAAPAAKSAAPAAKTPDTKPGVKIKWAEPMDAKY
jgi:uncharacterized membrane protein